MRPIRRVALGYIAFYLAIGAVFPYLPIHYRTLGFDLAAIGLITALVNAIALVGAPVWGALSDRFHRSRLPFAGASLLGAAGAVLLGGATTFPAVIGAASVNAAGQSGIGSVLDSRTLETLGPDERIRFGQLRAWGSVAFIVGALGVGLLVDRFGTPALFLVWVPGLILTALVALSLPRAEQVRTGSAFRGAARLLRNRELMLFLGAALVVSIGFNAVTWFYSIRLVALGGSPGSAGLVWAVGALIEAPLMYAFPRLAARFGSERLILVGSFLFALRALLAAFASEPWMLVAISPVEGIAYALFFIGGVDRVAHRAPAGYAATAQGLYSASSGIAAIIGSAVGGRLADATSIPVLYAASGFLGLVGLLALGLAFRERAGRTAPDADGAPGSGMDGAGGQLDEADPLAPPIPG